MGDVANGHGRSEPERGWLCPRHGEQPCAVNHYGPQYGDEEYAAELACGCLIVGDDLRLAP